MSGVPSGECALALSRIGKIAGLAPITVVVAARCGKSRCAPRRAPPIAPVRYGLANHQDSSVMRLLPVIILTLLLPFAWAAGSGGTAPLHGKVLETMDAGPYTYLRLQTAKGETWAAVPKVAVQKGQQVTIQGPMTMTQFESRTLNRTFDTIVFGSLAGVGLITI